MKYSNKQRGGKKRDLKDCVDLISLTSKPNNNTTIDNILIDNIETESQTCNTYRI